MDECKSKKKLEEEERWRLQKELEEEERWRSRMESDRMEEEERRVKKEEEAIRLKINEDFLNKVNSASIKIGNKQIEKIIIMSYS